MTDAQKERYLEQLRKVLGELNEAFPDFVTPAYTDRRLAEEVVELKKTP